MSDTVLKPFNSHRRRWVEGDKISPEADVEPLDYPSLKKRHFIGDPDKSKAAKAS